MVAKIAMLPAIAQPGGMVLSFDMTEGHRGGRWLRGRQVVHSEELVGGRVNRQHDRVPTREFLRIFRNWQGDRCAELADGEENQVLVSIIIRPLACFSF